MKTVKVFVIVDGTGKEIYLAAPNMEKVLQYIAGLKELNYIDSITMIGEATDITNWEPIKAKVSLERTY